MNETLHLYFVLAPRKPGFKPEAGEAHPLHITGSSTLTVHEWRARRPVPKD